MSGEREHMFCTMSRQLCVRAHLGLDLRLGMRVRITLLIGILCTATGRANPTFFPPMSKEMYVYTTGVRRCATEEACERETLL